MTQDVEAFRQAVDQNPALQKEVKALVVAQGIDYKAISELGEKHNFSFTAEEAQQLLMASNDELSDFELEMVAAGGVCCQSGL